MKKNLEVACFTLEAALIAANSGANRIEFCADASTGGVTPEIEDFIELKNKTNVPVFVMIRPRGGSYVYSDEEVDQMCEEAEEFLNAGADGLVFGALTADGKVDEKNCSRLIRIADDLPCTFHRAFDEIANKKDAIDALCKIGYTRILTSGNPGAAPDHADLIRELTDYADGRIIIMPGGGVRSRNVNQLLQIPGLTEFHSSGILSGDLPDEGEIKALLKSTVRE